MKLYGLTGGIGCGKSVVSKMLKDAGIPVIDADILAREVLAPGEPAHREIAQRFPEVIDDLGTVNRSRLGALIFSSEKERAALNAITHPRIRARARAQANVLRDAGNPIVVYDAPLLIESGGWQEVDGVILVSCSPNIQLERLMARDGLGREQAEVRIGAQMPLHEKSKFATWIIDNTGTLDNTRRQVDALVGKWGHTKERA